MTRWRVRASVIDGIDGLGRSSPLRSPSAGVTASSGDRTLHVTSIRLTEFSPSPGRGGLQFTRPLGATGGTCELGARIKRSQETTAHDRGGSEVGAHPPCMLASPSSRSPGSTSRLVGATCADPERPNQRVHLRLGHTLASRASRTPALLLCTRVPPCRSRNSGFSRAPGRSRET
jgi:hypothetical protein